MKKPLIMIFTIFIDHHILHFAVMQSNESEGGSLQLFYDVFIPNPNLTPLLLQYYILYLSAPGYCVLCLVYTGDNKKDLIGYLIPRRETQTRLL